MVNIELVIQSADESINIVVLRGGRLIELHQLPLDKNFCSVFDIYLAKVKRIASSLNAAFVGFGQDKDAFLHYHDLGPYFKHSNKFVNNTIIRKSTRWNQLESNFKESLPKDGVMEDVSLDGDMEDDSLAGDMEDDNLAAGFQEGVCEIVPQRLSL